MLHDITKIHHPPKELLERESLIWYDYLKIFSVTLWLHSTNMDQDFCIRQVLFKKCSISYEIISLAITRASLKQTVNQKLRWNK